MSYSTLGVLGFALCLSAWFLKGAVYTRKFPSAPGALTAPWTTLWYLFKVWGGHFEQWDVQQHASGGSKRPQLLHPQLPLNTFYSCQDCPSGSSNILYRRPDCHPTHLRHQQCLAQDELVFGLCGSASAQSQHVLCHGSQDSFSYQTKTGQHVLPDLDQELRTLRR